jgi:hypothetical protein
LISIPVPHLRRGHFHPPPAPGGVANGVVLDFDDEGGIVGIDVQHASKHADTHCLMPNAK